MSNKPLTEEQMGWFMFIANARHLNGAPVKFTEDERNEAREKFNVAPEELKKKVIKRYWELRDILGDYNI